MTTEGAKHRSSSTDLFFRCKGCGRVFYFKRDTPSGTWVRCPHCGTIH